MTINPSQDPHNGAASFLCSVLRGAARQRCPALTSRTAVVRTRMPGGGGGVASRGAPLSRSIRDHVRPEHAVVSKASMSPRYCRASRRRSCCSAATTARSPRHNRRRLPRPCRTAGSSCLPVTATASICCNRGACRDRTAPHPGRIVRQPENRPRLGGCRGRRRWLHPEGGRDLHRAVVERCGAEPRAVFRNKLTILADRVRRLGSRCGAELRLVFLLYQKGWDPASFRANRLSSWARLPGYYQLYAIKLSRCRTSTKLAATATIMIGT